MSQPTTDLIDRIAVEVQELSPVRLSNGGLNVGGLLVRYEDGSQGRPAGLLVRTGGRRNQLRTLRNLDPAHIARQLRRILAEQAKHRAEREQHRIAVAARQAREEAASADIYGLIEAVNSGRRELAGRWAVEELANGDVQYDIALHRLTGTQMRAVLAFLTPAGV